MFCSCVVETRTVRLLTIRFPLCQKDELGGKKHERTNDDVNSVIPV